MVLSIGMNPFQTFELIFLITRIKTSSKNDERTKRRAEEPGLLLHNIITILYLPPSL